VLITCKRKGSPDDAGRSEVNQASLFSHEAMSQAKPFPSLLCSFWGALLLHYHLRGKQTEIDRSYQKA